MFGYFIGNTGGGALGRDRSSFRRLIALRGAGVESDSEGSSSSESTWECVSWETEGDSEGDKVPAYNFSSLCWT